MDCCCFPVSGKKEKLSLLGLKPHGWWQRKKGQHKCAGFKECKSGRAAANKERSDTWGIAWYLLAITDMDFFFSLLPRFIWCFLFCSVLCWLANWSPFLCLEVSIYIHGLLSKTFHKICSISVKILLLISLLIEMSLHARGIKAQIYFLSIIVFLEADVCWGWRVHNLVLTYLCNLWLQHPRLNQQRIISSKLEWSKVR